jgi:ketosteroid isomerase-like protein
VDRAGKILWCVALAACAGATPPPARVFVPADRAAVKAVLEAQMTAWNAGDIDGYMAGYAKIDGLVFTSGGKIRRGFQQTHDAFKNKYAKDPSAMGHLVFEILSIDPVGADGAVVLGNWVLTNSPSDGRGVFSVILERRPEGWKVIHDHTSASPP